MKTPRSLFALTAVNFALLLLTIVQQLRPAFAQSELPVLRGRALEIVDAQGRIRASINVLPPAKSPNGDAQAETVGDPEQLHVEAEALDVLAREHPRSGVGGEQLEAALRVADSRRREATCAPAEHASHEPSRQGLGNVGAGVG